MYSLEESVEIDFSYRKHLTHHLSLTVLSSTLGMYAAKVVRHLFFAVSGVSCYSHYSASRCLCLGYSKVLNYKIELVRYYNICLQLLDIVDASCFRPFRSCFGFSR
jgi:thiamine transporter ThiT